MCGLCLALRADHGQLARIVTHYDAIVISVLTEAQSPREGLLRRTAGPCALRGMRTASVSRGQGAHLAGAVSLVLAAAKVRDHVADGDGLLARRPVAGAARRLARGWAGAARRSGEGLGFDTAVLLTAADRQGGIEALAGPGTPLTAVTEPTETATGAAFAHTAVLAGRPHNGEPLTEAGRLFGRLAHLLDAVEDQGEDAARGAWNPLTATGTSRAEARRLADDALHGIRLALQDVDFTDGALAHRLLVHELPRSVDRAFGTSRCGHGTDGSHGPGGAEVSGADEAGGAEAGGAEGAGGAEAGGVDEAGGNPYAGGNARRPTGGRGFWAGCGAFFGVCCTCRMCCSEEYEGPWSRKKRTGCCCFCECCEACEICEICECCGACA